MPVQCRPVPARFRHPRARSWGHEPLLASRRPSGLQAIAAPRSVWPVSVWRQSPLSTSHSFTVRSQLPLARVRPSGAKASPVTQVVCPASTCTLASGFCPGAVSHSRMPPSWPPLASRRPSGTPGQCLHWAVQAGECPQKGAGGCVPESNDAITSTAGQCPSVGAKAMRWILWEASSSRADATLQLPQFDGSHPNSPWPGLRPSG